MITETAVMERFVAIIQNDEELSNPLHNRLQVYRDMVHFRFLETVENVYPILTAKLGPQLIHELIREFIARGAKTPFIVKMSQEFADFLRDSPKTKEYPFLEDLLWFECGELDLLTRQFNDRVTTCEWDRRYTLSSSSMIRSVSYRIHDGEFETPSTTSLMLYYHFDEERVYFEEITLFAQQLIKKLETVTLEVALIELAEMYELDIELLRDSVEQLVEKWCTQRVLIQCMEV